MSPTVSIALTIDIRHMAIITVKFISKPYLNGSGKANHAALSIPEKFTSPMKIAIIYAVIIPKSTDELEIIPFVQNFNPKETNITIIASDQFPNPPQVGFDILNSPAPPAAY